MLNRLRHLQKQYPRQFWLLFWGMLIATSGTSMIWPFLMIYVSDKLQLPLTVTASLMTLNAFAGLVFSFIAGPVTDRAGRKWVMIISLAGNGLTYILLSLANSLPAFAALMFMRGMFDPLYRVGADAMMADLIPPEQRADAYSLLRTSNNLGIALGPSIGGLVATISYSAAFYGAAIGLLTFSLLILFLAAETLPHRQDEATRPRERLGGYDRILSDRVFVFFCSAFTLTAMSAAILWALLGVYSKHNYGLPERLYGLIPTTNALMVVLFQYFVTQVTKRYKPLPVLAVGAMFYATGVGMVAFGRDFWGFWLSMVVMTLGELIMTPTATTLVANLAPADMRGRYMSIFGLTWGIGVGIGPLAGGLLNDWLGPAYIWYGGFCIGLLSAIVFVLMSRRYTDMPVAVTAPRQAT